jgi:hypothetical protein
MARILPRSMPGIRHLLLALLAVGLVMRLGAGCEAMAAVAVPVAVGDTHCADMPAHPDKPAKLSPSICALCAALPDATPAAAATPCLEKMLLDAAPIAQLAGLDFGPAPPPPRVA